MGRGSWILRGCLGVASVVVLWLAQRRFDAWQGRVATTFRWNAGGWFGYVGLLVLAGFVLGLGAVLPLRLRYRVVPALTLGAIPLLLLARTPFLLGYAAPHRVHLPSWFTQPYFLAGTSAEFALAVLLGVALAAGFSGA